MTDRNFQVRFTLTSVGADGNPLSDLLDSVHASHGSSLPEISLNGDHWQVRELRKVGQVWRGVFAKLGADVPHIVDDADEERELELNAGERILEKGFFLYYENKNALVWQNTKVAGTSKFANYLSQILDTIVMLPPIVNTDALDEAMSRGIHELQFTYARPPTLDEGSPRWRQDAFDLLNSVHGAVGKFTLRGGHQQSLAGRTRQIIQGALQSAHVKKVKVKFTDEPLNLVDLLASPVKDQITVPMIGRYPIPARIFEELALAYSRQLHLIP